MKIIKVLNTSSLLAEDIHHKKLLLFGKGIGFGQKAGSLIPAEKVEKSYILNDAAQYDDYLHLIQETPHQLIEITKQIIQFAGERLEHELNPYIFLSLLDHLKFALDRYHDGVYLPNKLIWEIGRLYPVELELGRFVVAYINEKMSIRLPEDEAGNIAYHFINAQQSQHDQAASSQVIVQLLKEIITIIEDYFQIAIDKSSLNFTRLVTHLQFFLQRLIENETNPVYEEFLFQIVKKEYAEEYSCALQVAEYIAKVLNREVEASEIMFLTLHINRVVSR